MRRSLAFLTFASLSAAALSATVSSNARAQSWGARLVRALDKVGRTDLVADANGKIPVSVTLPPGAALPPGSRRSTWTPRRCACCPRR
ncbi:MAG: hypothetical protein R3F14_25015 [Polyangiaceae bacterium]